MLLAPGPKIAEQETLHALGGLSGFSAGLRLPPLAVVEDQSLPLPRSRCLQFVRVCLHSLEQRAPPRRGLVGECIRVLLKLLRLRVQGRVMIR